MSLSLKMPIDLLCQAKEHGMHELGVIIGGIKTGDEVDVGIHKAIVMDTNLEPMFCFKEQRAEGCLEVWI